MVGLKTGYTSSAESGIMEDLGLSVAAVSTKSFFIYIYIYIYIHTYNHVLISVSKYVDKFTHHMSNEKEF
jgi:hypothetical protein